VKILTIVRSYQHF